MKQRHLLPLLLVVALALAGCGGEPGGWNETRPEGGPPHPETDGGPPYAETQDGPPHEDEEGLARVMIEDGGASVILFPEKWPDLSEVFGEDVFCGEPGQGVSFPVKGLSGKVKDACVGKMPWLVGADRYGHFEMPVVVFLMEDGSLEWMFADPYWLVGGADFGYDDVAYSWGRILWIEDIVALSYAPETDGRGDLTIFAEDDEGLLYDLRRPCGYQSILYSVWDCELQTEDASGYHAYLEFGEDGALTLQKGWDRDNITEIYRGSYRFCLADNEEYDYRAGCVEIDLVPEWWIWDGGDGTFVPEEIHGVYFANIDQGHTLRLWLADGDALHTENGESAEGYEFYICDMSIDMSEYAEMSDQELVDYLLSAVPEAKRMVEVQGMSVLVTGEITEFENAAVCRDIWLGTDREESFVREILYTVSPWGAVYQYDPLGDGWSIVYP